jgi:hypothetical protein
MDRSADRLESESDMISPREYAAKIIDGELTINEVPDYLHDLVSSLLDEWNAMIWSRASDIIRLPSLIERRWAISQIDESIRQVVKHKVAEMWICRGN